MAVYHQMGYDSGNLLYEEHLGAFRGAILSPVNYGPEDLPDLVSRARSVRDFELIFDPQLYSPRTERGHLREWQYFPADVDTADLSSIEWWYQLTEELVQTCAPLGVTAVCSPVSVPQIFSDEYFNRMQLVGRHLTDRLAGTGMETVQTLAVGLAELCVPDRAMTIASILSRPGAHRVFLVLVSRAHPRRELSNADEVKGAMKLIAALEHAGLRVLVGFSSSDIVLWRAAGASDCATGKFFNLRRFTPSRFEEPPEGGGQVAYWFEEALMAFLRESDLIRARQRNILSAASLANPFGQRILAQLEGSPGTPWLAPSWRQFMYWFADFDRRISEGTVEVQTLLGRAEGLWLELQDATPPLLMEEPRNDGGWLRAWRRALVEFRAE